jgi:hypothetical protein
MTFPRYRHSWECQKVESAQNVDSKDQKWSFRSFNVPIGNIHRSYNHVKRAVARNENRYTGGIQNKPEPLPRIGGNGILITTNRDKKNTVRRSEWKSLVTMDSNANVVMKIKKFS